MKNTNLQRFTLSPFLMILSLLPCLTFAALTIPLEFHGRGLLGKYLNPDTTRFNMDASIELYCTCIRLGNSSFFLQYRDDLDMAEQQGGVSLDPRYAHYYIVGGFDYLSTKVLCALSFTHDCVHDIDIEDEGTPVFNRFRIQCASAHMHPSLRLKFISRFLWMVELGVYPHWSYHGWDINDGADYQYELIVAPVFNIVSKNSIGFDAGLRLHITKGDSTYYHQHLLQANFFYQNGGRRTGVELDYNIKNNDVIKNPDKLWLLSIFAEF